MHVLAPFTALLISTALLVAGHALHNALIPLRGEAEAFSAFWLGGLSSSFFLGYALGCWFAPRLVASVGHIRVFAAFVGLMSGTILLHPLAIEPMVWSALRIVSGFAMATLYIIIESWLNERTDNANRGMVMSSYITINFLMIVAGQLLLTTYPLESFALFTLASVLISFAAVPLALSRATQPAPLYDVRLNLTKLVRTSPVGVIGILGVGMSTGAFWGFGGIYATRAGLSNEEVALFLSIAIAGAALAQWPAGRLSDRVDRRIVMCGLMISGAVTCLAVFVMVPTSVVAIMIAGVAFGATVFPAYAVVVAHTFDHGEQDQHVTIASGLLLIFAIGSVVGPLAASAFVEMLGGTGLFVFAGAVQFALALFVIVRLTIGTPVAAEEKEDFTVYATAPVGAVLVDSELDEQDIDLMQPEPVIFPPDADSEPAEDEAGDMGQARQDHPGAAS